MRTKKPSTRSRKPDKELIVAVIVSNEVLHSIRKDPNAALFHSRALSGQHSCFIGTSREYVLNAAREACDDWGYKMKFNGKGDPHYQIIIGAIRGHAAVKFRFKVVPIQKGD